MFWLIAEFRGCSQHLMGKGLACQTPCNVQTALPTKNYPPNIKAAEKPSLVWNLDSNCISRLTHRVFSFCTILLSPGLPRMAAVFKSSGGYALFWRELYQESVTLKGTPLSKAMLLVEFEMPG